MLVIKIDTSAFKALGRDIATIQRAIPMAIARGLNEGGDKVRTEVQHALWKQTGLVRYSSVTTRMKTARAFAEGSRTTGFGGALTYQIIANGKGIPVKEFPVSVGGEGVDAKTWGVDHLFKRSFQQKYKGGLRARLGKEHSPIRALYGPSLPKELGKGAVPAKFFHSFEQHVPPAIVKHLLRVFG